MKVYIAGPIAGYPDKNRLAFALAASRLLALGHDPVNPHDVPVKHEGPCRGDVIPRVEEPDEHRYGCYMKADILALLECDAITLLEGWEHSRGASVEERVAEILGLEYINLNDDSRWQI